ncbi:MAG: bifunctional diaminohydroxyphosphoribosylaminopyrimidine deaminase/5-amino-6-(5-phosphoribosylamino)uracil reductase RibD [Betaproteobacteria bacterium]|nr:bifunctional diaminohydroxyphosphoribosylaminopyrimidine deaminase/5-amino-6-(5-phosphoribosylamino)uracil reductase RibD [Betaproteobacteria bacterium]MDH5342468.1 bifunctional diaminohydroxyphosphoribosylaminopyrimidine deaminase/5-amino-6-(5-phosphoribosylamino)uracil reductase RibD [Betaproteobacteria bacterium]
MYTPDDQRHMARALELAARGLFTTTPNPRVGCVVVKDGVVAGEGWHEKAGESHAEPMALQAADGKAAGATVYVTLEPCAHHGRTPPCVDALLAAKPARVVAAIADPNPDTAGKGLEKLRAAGITVDVGLMDAEARELNIGFFARMTRGTPWVRMKVAASLDGRTALADGQSQWITGDAARKDGHAWRARACAVLTGVGTVKSDDPQLNVRDVETTRQPLRVVVDSRLQTPLNARVLRPGTLFAAAGVDAPRSVALRARGAEVVVLPNHDGKVELPDLLQELARRGCNEIHVEAGHKLNGSLLQAGLVDELLIYMAPCILGDTAQGMFHLPPLAKLADRCNVRITDVQQIGADLRVLARVDR